MSCSRCKGAFCWICRRDISDVHYDHFSPENMFGCNGMTEVPQCILCWIFLMTLMIIVSPIAVAIRMGHFLGKYVLGKCMGGQHSLERMVGYERQGPFTGIYVFGLGVFYFPIVIVMTVVMWPPVFLYKLWVLLGIVFRNFLCCCFC